VAIACFCDHCGAENATGDTICCACQKPLAPHAEAIGTLLNERYEVLNEVGAGGFGAVYKARDTREGERLVAVKGINLQGLSAQEIIEATDAFNREAEILSTLSHPLLPTIFDRFSDPEHWYLVMTYIDGSTLDEYLQQHQVSGLHVTAGLPLSETLTIALQLCDALHYLHSQQPAVIFRDLKPGNIMRTRKGRLYLIDFGIARRFKPGQAKDTIPFGSPGFAAPEQYGRAQTTPQADIYSLGALLYCLLTGDDPSEHPFDFPALRHCNIDGIHELNALIRRMVALDPAQRPADIQEVQAELQRIQQLNNQANQQGRLWTPPQGQTPPADGSGPQHIFLNSASNAQPQKRKTTRRRVLTTTLVLGGVAAFGGFIALANQPQPQSVPPIDQSMYQPTVAPADQTATAQAQAAANQTAIAQEPTPTAQNTGPTPTEQTPNVFQNSRAFWSPDLSQAAVINTTSSTIDFYLNQGQKPFGTLQPSIFSSSLTVQWSSDNQQVVVFQDGENGDVWDVRSQSKLFTLPGSIVSLPILAWSPNGKYLAATYRDQNNAWILNLLATQNGASVWRQTIAQQTVTCLGWSPNSRYFVFPVLDNSVWTLEIWDSQTLQKIQTVSNPNDPDFYPASTVLAVSWSPLSQQVAFVLQVAGGTTQLWVANLGNLTGTVAPKQVSSAFSFGSSLAWSPNEKYIAELLEGNLGVWDTTSGQAIFSTQTSTGDSANGILTAFAWVPDSHSILTVDNTNTLARWSVG
jgi:serine/threonine protein kinase